MDAFDLPPPAIERALGEHPRAPRAWTSDVLISARAPRRVVAGKRVRVRVTVQRRSGGRRTLSVPVRIPRDLRPGRRTLAPDRHERRPGSAEEASCSRSSEVFDEFGGGAEPRTIGELARRIAGGTPGRGHLRAHPARQTSAWSTGPTTVSFEGRRAGQAGGSPGAPLTAGSPPLRSSIAASTEVWRLPSEATSSLKSCGWVAALRASSIDTRPAW